MITVAVIGAGPAGSLAAIRLARAGVSVELFEQHAFPRDKVCGECLSALGIDVLKRAQLDGLISPLHPVQLSQTILHPLDAPAIRLPLPRTMWGISRFAMDSVLLNAARNAGVVIHQPARCERITFGPHPTVTFRPAQAAQTRTVSADWILLADGKGALLPPAADATGDLGIKTHFAAVNGPRDTIELFAGRRAYGGLAAIENNRWNAAFAVPATLVRSHRGNLQAVFDQIVADNPTLSNRMRTARRVGPWLAAPLPRFAVKSAWPANVIPLGNAAAALEPVGGEGMGLALRSAELAAEALLAFLTTGNPGCLEKLPSTFDSLWRRRRIVCRSIARLFSSEYADLVSPLLLANPRLPVAVMWWAGKGE